MKTFLKALVVFWPFFKSMIFRDRPVKEVLRQNVQFTALFFLSMLLTCTLYWTWTVLVVRNHELHSLKTENTVLRNNLEQNGVPVSGNDQTCHITTYDKSRIIKLMED